jgi:predicted dehydrogenase
LLVAAGAEPQPVRAANEKIAFACIGIDGKGASDSNAAGGSGDVVAICDVDDAKLDAAAKRFPKAKKFNDFRKLLDEMGKSIDAVTVSTPDHCHAPAALMAMRMGKHCFCQKPLTHSIYEARLMATTARETKVATQMGNQGTAEPSLRRAAAMLRAGAVGTVTEVHVWTNRPIWPQGIERPPQEDCPSNLHWDLWLGPAPKRPYAKGYHPFKWRGWWDFGTGALGDMACHTVNMPYMGLELKNPTSVAAVTSGHNRDSYPAWSVIAFEYPATDWRPALKFFWYDGGKRPGNEYFEGLEEIQRAKVKEEEKQAQADGGQEQGKGKKKKKRSAIGVDRSGCLVVGSKGKLYAPGDYAERGLIMLGGAQEVEVNPPKSPGHFIEWVEAIRGGQPAMSNFANYSGGLTETILLGNLAVWAADKITDDKEQTAHGKLIQWDAKNLKTLNAPEVEHIVKPAFYNGYHI